MMKTLIKKIIYKIAYLRFRAYTMIPRNIYENNLDLCFKYRNLSGDIVECGVWKGGMIAGIANIIRGPHGYVLFDSFQGLPEAKDIDGLGAMNWQNNKDDQYYFDNCNIDKAHAEKAMQISGIKSYKIIEGWFEDTLKEYTPSEGIAILRLDCDWYDSTMSVLNHLFPKVKSGGIIIIDDYYTWDGCSRAVHNYLSNNNRTERIKMHNNSVCYIEKSE